ncbi:MAG: methyltransferase [Pseudomonadota bacterium]
MNDTSRVPLPPARPPERPTQRFGRGPRAWMLRLAASERFQAFSARMPGLSSKAKREGEALFDLVAGFAQSQVLFALVELGVIDRLSNGAAQPSEILPELGDREAQLLLDGGVAIGLLRKSARGYGLTVRGAALLGVPGLLPMIRHHGVFYRDMSDPVALLRGERSPELARFWPYVFGAGAAENPEIAQTYSDLMAQSQKLVAEDTLRAVSFAETRELLDIGGGTGAFLCALGHRFKAPKLHLFDLPAVAPGAESRFRAEHLSARARITPGSFRDDPLPRGADTISLVRVLYDHADETVTALLQKVHDALPPGGRIVISEPMTGGETPSVAGDVYFAFYTYCMATGQARSQARIVELLGEAGFSNIEAPKPRRAFVTSVVTGEKIA